MNIAMRASGNAQPPTAVSVVDHVSSPLYTHNQVMTGRGPASSGRRLGH